MEYVGAKELKQEQKELEIFLKWNLIFHCKCNLQNCQTVFLIVFLFQEINFKSTQLKLDILWKYGMIIWSTLFSKENPKKTIKRED